MKLEALLKLANDKRAEAARGKSIEIQAALTGAYNQVKEVLTGMAVTEIDKPKAVFELCERLDGLEIDPRIRAVFDRIRAVILPVVLEQLHLEEKTQKPLQRGEQQRSLELTKNQNLVKLTAELLVVLKKENPEAFGPTWIQSHVGALWHLVRDEKLGWNVLKDILPESWKKRFVSERYLSFDEKISKDIEEYRHIAEILGPEALAEFLVILNPEDHRDFSKIMRIITQYLGRSQVRAADFKSLAELPSEALLLAGFRETVFVRLRNYVYQELVKVHESDTDQHQLKLVEIEAIATKILGDDKPVHRKLLGDLMSYYRDVLAIKPSARMVSALKNKAGEFGVFPSLRQRIAMREMEKDPDNGKFGRLLVSFFMGGGKTATAFLAKEHVGAKKMLYLCPNSDLVNQTATRVEKYYKKEKEPSVGTVTAGMTEATVLENLKKEVVVVPFSMFSANVGKVRLVDLLKSQGFDMVTVDEAHNARKDEGRNTDTIYELITGIPDLYEKGHVMLLSGDPVPNSPDDIAPQLRIYDKDTYSEVGSLQSLIRKLDPLKVKNALLKFLLILDEPENWQANTEIVYFDLSEEEQHIYNEILGDSSIPLLRKLEELMLGIKNPSLRDASYDVAGTLACEVASKIIEDLNEYPVVMIGEPGYKGGVLRPHAEHPDVPTFVDRVKTLMGDQSAHVVAYDKTMKDRTQIQSIVEAARAEGTMPVITAVYDGNTTEGDRQDILKLSKEADGLGIKMVIFAMMSTVREGIDLSHIYRAYALAPDFNQPDFVQWLKRFVREGNKEAKVGVFVAPTTILEGIQLHALQKAILCNRIKYGGILTEVELAFFKDNLGGDLSIEAGKVVFGTHIVDKLINDEQRLERLASYLNGKGCEEHERLMSVYGRQYAEIYTKDWNKTFSANNGRLVAGLIEELRRKRLITGTHFADVAAGPMVLANTLGKTTKDVEIDSFDSNSHMLDKGKTLSVRKQASGAKLSSSVSRMDEIKIDQILVPDGAYDCVNLADAMQYTNLNTKKKDPKNDERARVLLEQNRILKPGGVLIITLPVNTCSVDELTALSKELSNFGFKILDDYSGYGKSNDGADGDFANWTIVCEKIGIPNLGKIDLKKLKLTSILANGSGKKSKKSGVNNAFIIKKHKLVFSTL